MIFALVGNQNCGKTTLFNQLTGSNQHVGNFPGVTVDSKEGVMRGAKGCSVVDLPGIYSLRPYTAEEIVTRDFILNQKPDGIINIVDATNIERNLYLTLQLLEMQIPMVLALNMMDEVRGQRAAPSMCRKCPTSSAFRSFPSLRRRTRASRSWSTVPCVLHARARCRSAWISVMTVRCTAASTPSRT